MLYLLLRRHHDIMRLAQTVILHPDELTDAAATVTLVQDAFNYRVQVITGAYVSYFRRAGQRFILILRRGRFTRSTAAECPS